MEIRDKQDSRGQLEILAQQVHPEIWVREDQVDLLEAKDSLDLLEP